jgi:hypothetical protein
METAMRINRTLVYAGVFLVAIGLAIFAVDQRPFATDTVLSVLRLWPLALIAIGAGIALRRTQLGLASGLIAAAVPGLLLGVTMAATPPVAIDSGFAERIRAAYRHEYECADFSGHIRVGDLEITPMGGCK